MNFEIFLLTLTGLWMNAQGLRCWTCHNVKSNLECQRRGELKTCLENENSCHNEIRRGSYGTMVTKRCKQDWACTNNEIQNPRDAWSPSQCNTRVPSSVCRCCCKTDGCNADLMCKRPEERVLDCAPIRSPRFGRKSCDFVRSANEIGSTCSFTCNKNYRRVGARKSSCMPLSGRGKFSNPPPTCVYVPRDCAPVKPPQHGLMNCTKDSKPGSVCSFECENFFVAEADEYGPRPIVIPSAHELMGEKEIRCEPSGRWSAPSPACVAIMCSAISLSDNLQMSCTYGNHEGSTCSFACSEGYEVIGSSETVCRHEQLAGGKWTHPVPTCKRIECLNYPKNLENGFFTCTNEKFLDSECKFSCLPNYKIFGSNMTRCIQEGSETDWNFRTPTCAKIECESQTLHNGRISCTDGNYAGSSCSYECIGEDFVLDPLFAISATCMQNSQWSAEKPCCSKICPPHSVVDLVFAIDSSSSIGARNWVKMKSFVEDIIKSFVIGDNATHVGAFRYNREIDDQSQVLLKDFPNSKRKLLRAVDKIPYDGRAIMVVVKNNPASSVVVLVENAIIGTLPSLHNRRIINFQDGAGIRNNAVLVCCGGGGTFTGQALRHASNVMFHSRNGNRPGVSDILIVITDGTSFDSITLGAQMLLENHIHVFVVGVVPQSGRLNHNQLRELVTHEDDLFISASGFDGLNASLFNDLLLHIECQPGCSRESHEDDDHDDDDHDQ